MLVPMNAEILQRLIENSKLNWQLIEAKYPKDQREAKFTEYIERKVKSYFPNATILKD